MTRMLIAAALAVVSSVATAQSVSVPVTLSEFKLELKSDTVKAGSVTFKVNNAGSMIHQFHVAGQGLEKETRPIPVNQSASLTVTLKPGTYEIYCPMSEDSHRKGGMTKKLIVTGGEAAAPKKPDA